jgi:UDP-N-acetylmuramoylalanine--D-glutamate ligase
MHHPRNYANKKVVVLGLARSGRAAAAIFHQYGADVVVNDKKERHLCPEADELEALGVSVICGYHPDNLVDTGVSLVVKNPGIPYTAEPIVQAAALGIEIVTEIEVAYHISESPMIGITGSNGKTTTTTWVGEMLKAEGLNPLIAGNIGKPLCEAVLEAESGQWLVVELSSFQLKGISEFRPRISCLLNISETHLDYHGTMEDYTESKGRLFRNQTAEDVAIINWDDEKCRAFIPLIRASVMPFSRKETLDAGVYVQRLQNGVTVEEWITYRGLDGTEQRILKTEELGIPGSHNVENALAAAAAAISSDVKLTTIAEVLSGFKGVEHRLEHTALHKGIDFYNDSKSTNPSATIQALESFKQQVILIAGGLDRGSDYKELEPYFKDKVKALVVLGETGHKISKIAELAGIALVRSVDNGKNAAESVQEAVETAYSLAEAGDIVLLSPACASWDMFPSYEERGRMFKESVHTLL